MGVITIEQDPQGKGIRIEYPALPVGTGTDSLVIQSLSELGYSDTAIGFMAITAGYLQDNPLVAQRYDGQSGLETLREVVRQVRQGSELPPNIMDQVHLVLGRVSEKVLRGEARIEYKK